MRIIASALSIVFLVTSFDACIDFDDQKLPVTSSTGAGTFGYRVNGKVDLPREFGAYEPDTDMLVVYARGRYGNFKLTVRDTIDGIEAHKIYYFDNDKKEVRCEFDDGRCTYDENPVSGYIRFSKIDDAGHIISGVFEFSVSSPYCNKTIDITDGRFDLYTDLQF